MPTASSSSEYLNPAWTSHLSRLGLASFEAFWRLPQDWFETPNYKRGGWSGVSCHRLDVEDANPPRLFVKRQQNYYLKSFWHRLLGITSLKREFENLKICEREEIPVALPVYFGTRRTPEGRQSILALPALDDYQSLDLFMEKWRNMPRQHFQEKCRAARSSAALIAKLHAKGYAFNALYPKHIMLHKEWIASQKEGAEPARFIDLERLAQRSRRKATLSDLEKLNRHTRTLPASLRLRFFMAYQGIAKLRAEDKALLRQIARRSGRK